MELELKYRVVEPAGAEALLAADEIAGFGAVDQVRSVQHDDRYLDTGDGALARAGFGARLRQHAGETIISVKSLGHAVDGGALHRREELEGPAAPGMPPADWPPSPARSLVLELAGDAPLVEVVTIRQLRRKREYRREGALVEVSLDAVDVVVHGRVIDRFEELEVEVVEGDEDALEAIVGAVEAAPGLGPVEGSKFERALAAVHRENAGTGGLAEVVLAAVGSHLLERRTAAPPAEDGNGVVVDLRERSAEVAPDGGDPIGTSAEVATTEAVDVEPVGTEDAAGTDEATDAEGTVETAEEPPRLVPGKSPGVTADDHIAEAGRKVLRFHLARMLAREPGTRAGKEPEELHGMRVATRRQRAAWRVFGDAFDRRATRRHERRLRVVARRLGAVRDLDVLIGGLESYRAGIGDGERRGLEPLLAEWRARREEDRLLLMRELDSPRYREWVDGYRDFVRTEGAAALPVGPVQPHRVRDTMPSRIWAAYEQVRAYESVLRWADVQTLHDLRIAAKWLRYTLEFAREALGPESTALIERVVAIQDHLGWLHDADVASNLARAFLVEHAGELTERESGAIGRYLVDRERELARLRRTIGPVWRGVGGLPYRRALGRVVASL